MACLWHDWVRAPRVHVLIFWRDRPRARCIGRVRLAALALPSGLNFGEAKADLAQQCRTTRDKMKLYGAASSQEG